MFLFSFLFCTRVREGEFCISKAASTALNERFHTTIKFLCRVVVLLKSRRNEEAGRGGARFLVRVMMYIRCPCFWDWQRPRISRIHCLLLITIARRRPLKHIGIYLGTSTRMSCTKFVYTYICIVVHTQSRTQEGLRGYGVMGLRCRALVVITPVGTTTLGHSRTLSDLLHRSLHFSAAQLRSRS